MKTYHNTAIERQHGKWYVCVDSDFIDWGTSRDSITGPFGSEDEARKWLDDFMRYFWLRRVAVKREVARMGNVDKITKI